MMLSAKETVANAGARTAPRMDLAMTTAEDGRLGAGGHGGEGLGDEGGLAGKFRRAGRVECPARNQSAVGHSKMAQLAGLRVGALRRARTKVVPALAGVTLVVTRTPLRSNAASSPPDTLISAPSTSVGRHPSAARSSIWLFGATSMTRPAGT